MTVTPMARPLFLVASLIPMAGTALINGTQTFCTWNVPNDGQVHRFMAFGLIDTTTLETGGACPVVWTAPDGTASGTGVNLLGPNLAVGLHQAEVNGHVKPGTTVTIQQQTALTSGAAVGWFEIW